MPYTLRKGDIIVPLDSLSLTSARSVASTARCPAQALMHWDRSHVNQHSACPHVFPVLQCRDGVVRVFHSYSRVLYATSLSLLGRYLTLNDDVLSVVMCGGHRIGIDEQIPIQDESVQDTNVDAQAEDEVVSSGSEQKQLNSEASELDTSNIIDDSPGVSTRGAKVDALKQEREIDQAVGAAEKADEST
ncbi:hypothetical protein PHSY_005984 [Pseudozyma hubeiensis SY62]|uniref:Uncharacterized protein n=1 Tax=Pseudozyma hubeiensis (strain SY62) TaxID=1305764 RepID=R9PJX4_PSEHS|nr:hypothetical protein PHSY_005984 [Pseudozyma hubeiensis SY62]GAC98390.1 hypothetical protein PHSY_005984 [Pseudozyma hubeiensis SY62]